MLLFIFRYIKGLARIVKSSETLSRPALTTSEYRYSAIRALAIRYLRQKKIIAILSGRM